MHLAPLIQDLAVILGAATLVSFLFQRIRQPVVLGYLLAGILVGPHTPPFSFVIDIPGIQTWADLGVIFLMFSLGLEFSFSKLIRVGRTAAITGPFEAFFMVGAGFLAGKVAHWSTINSLFLGAILAISSTTIIMKTLEEIGMKKRRFAHLIFGILVAEDLAGILILVGLSTLARTRGFSAWAFLGSAIQLLLLAASWIVIGSLTIPRLIGFVAKRSTDETLTLLSLCLCLGLVLLSAHFNYSVALGAFIMGSIIGESREANRIEKMILPIRNVFAAVFFVSIGMLFNPREVAHHWKAVLALTVLTVVGKTFSTAFAARMTGQPFRMALQLGLGLAQIGEFSFIIASLGITLGVMDPVLYSLAVAVSVITTFTTPFLIRISQAAFSPSEAKAPEKKAA